MGSVFDILNLRMADQPLVSPQSPAPEPEKQQTPAPQTSATPLNIPRMGTLRTFKADLDAAVKGENVSLATVAIREAEKRRALGILSDANTHSSTRKIILLSIALVALGLGVFGVGFLYFQSNPETTVPISARTPLIFADSESKLDTTTARTSDVIAFAQKKLRTIDRQIGTVEEIIFTEQKQKLGEEGTTITVEEPLTAQELIRGLGTAAPDGLLRSLEGSSMYGIYAWQTNHGFLLFKVTSYEKAFDELLSWEKRFMARDLLPLLEETIPREGINETVFRDAIIRNIDTRVLRDAQGTPILIYGFLNNQNLAIAGSQETFIEIVSRFTTPRPVVR